MPPPPISVLPSTTIFDLTLKILSHFVPSALSEAQNAPRDGYDRPPPEALYGNEFFRAAHKVLKGRCFPSPEFGYAKAKEGTGWMDLYIPDYKFGFEYLRAGNNIEGHAARFLEGGSYKKWIDSGDIVDYIILDFRFTKPRDPHTHSKSRPVVYHVLPRLNFRPVPKLFHVIFDCNFRNVKVFNSALNEVSQFNLPEI
jgi:hypothetical protein